MNRPIAILTPSNPQSGVRGIDLRTWHMATAFAQRKRTVVFQILWATQQAGPMFDPRPSIFETVILQSSRGYPVQGGGVPGRILLHSGIVFRRQLKESLTALSPCVVVVEFPYLVPVYAPILERLKCHIVLAEHNLEFQILREGHNILWPAVFMLERYAIEHSDSVLVTCPEDAEGIGHLAAGRRIWTIPLCVEVPELAEDALPDVGRINTPKDGTTWRLVFHGDFRYGPNIRALRVLRDRIFPRVLVRVPNAELRIFGLGIARGHSNRVQSLGTVENVARELSTCDIAVAPITEGGGMKTKVMECMASGLPVVTTTNGSRGLELASGENALISDDLEGTFVDCIVQLLTDPNSRRRIGRKGRLHVANRFSSAEVYSKYQGMLEDLG